MLPKHNFIFVRHGETEGNVKNLCQGKIDFPLTDLGRRQAQEAAKKLLPYNGQIRIFSSTQKRASDTARIIAETIVSLSFETMEGLEERGWGVLEGKDNKAMFEQEQREEMAGYMEPSGIDGLEEISKFKARISKTMTDILERKETGVPLIVGHGRFFRSLCTLMQIPEVTQIPNGTPVLCSADVGGWRIIEIHSGNAGE